MKIFLLLLCILPALNTQLFSQPDAYINEKEKLFYSFLYKNMTEEAEKTFLEFIESTPAKNFNYYNEYSLSDFTQYKNALENNNSNTNTLNLKITVLFINKIDAEYINGKGQKVFIRGTYGENTNDYDDSINLFEKTIQYFFDNKIKFDFDKVYIQDTIINEVKTIPYRKNSSQISLTLSPIKIKPYPDYIENHLDRTDLFIVVLPTEHQGLSSAGLVRYKINNEKSYTRGTIIINKNRLHIPQTLVHEFMHIIEQTYNIPENHFYEEINKQKWPEWYKGEGQLFYYKNFIEKRILTQDINKLKLSRYNGKK